MRHEDRKMPSIDDVKATIKSSMHWDVLAAVWDEDGNL